MKLDLPINDEKVKSLRAGDQVLLNGIIYSARDQAHKRLFDLIQSGKELPVDLRDETIFYMGPAPTPPGKIIGSCGPTTAYRMDPFTPTLLDYGIKGMIGKGNRSTEVVESIKKNGSIFFYAYGGCGALYARTIINKELVAFEDLGPEAIYRLEIINFPVIVAIDSKGNSIFS